MNTNPVPLRESVALAGWWYEAEVFLLIVLVIGAYCLRINDVTLRGEEPRRAQVAFEARERGDWFVPREQGEPFLSRPPLHNWMIAASTAIFGSRAAWAIRFPSLLGTLATTLLIYGYSRTSLSRLGSLAAAVAFTTLGEMFSTGYQAETEAVFIPLVSGALLLWHWGYVRAWPSWVTWMANCACVGLAVLAKGPQPPVYFLGTVSLYLVLTGDWRRLCTWSHLAGILVGSAIVLAWMVPCSQRVGWPAVWGIMGRDTATRFQDWKSEEVVAHVLLYPLEVFGGTLPWSSLLLCYLVPQFRRSLGSARSTVLFVTLSLAVSFPTCWIPPGGQTRYFAPLYPCLSVLIGLVVQRCAEVHVVPHVRRGWRVFLSLAACLTMATALAAVAVSLFLKGHPKFGSFAEPLPSALAYAGVVAILTALILRGRWVGDDGRVRSAVLALAWFLVITFAGPLTNARVRRSEDQPGAISRLKQRLPAGTKMISYGHTDALFAHYYGELIELRPIPISPNDMPEEGVYFSYHAYAGGRMTLPFPAEEIAAISMDRDRRPSPEREVVVGRALPRKR